MKRFLLFLAVFALYPVLSAAQEISGPWNGVLNAGSQSLEIVFRFERAADGSFSASMDIPAQSAKGIPAKLNVLTADSVSLEIAALQITYKGWLANGTIKGTFTQMGFSFPLDLEPGDFMKPDRPQEPEGPLPYATREVRIYNAADSIWLAGTLTYPVGYSKGEKVPVVVMVSGSGAQNRDEELYEHKPFLVIADRLARNGIASLRYDDRGVGSSDGTQYGCTSADFADDAESAVDFLKKSGEFGKTGVLGHSEGGMIAFMLGAKGVPDFIVSLAGPGIKGDTLLAEQQNAIYGLKGIKTQSTAETVRGMIAATYPGNTWFEFFLDYDPGPDLEKITVPVMAINGSNDLQVLPASNLGTIRLVLTGKNAKNLIREYPDLNHLFQHCTPETAMDYYAIEETCSEEVLKDIADWINSL